MGDPTVRSVQQQLLDIVSRAGAAGVSLTRDGPVTFDQSRVHGGLRRRPRQGRGRVRRHHDVRRRRGRLGLGPATRPRRPRPGPAATACTSTACATREQWSLGAGSLATGQVVTVARGATSASYTVQAGDGPGDDRRGHQRERRRGRGLGIGAADDGSGNLLLTAGDSAAAAALHGGRRRIGRQPAHRRQPTRPARSTGSAATGIGTLLSLPTGTQRRRRAGRSTPRACRTPTSRPAAATSASVSFAPGLAQSLVDARLEPHEQHAPAR